MNKRHFRTPDGCNITIEAERPQDLIAAIKRLEDCGLELGPPAPTRVETHHNADCDPPWIAVEMEGACRLLEGYELTEAERSSLPDIMAGYCRLLDEADMVGEGETEEEAIADALEKSQLNA